MRLSRNIVKISINQVYYNRFNSITRKYGNNNDINNNKILQNSTEGINGLLFKFKTLLNILFDERALSYGINLFDDGIIENLNHINIFNLLIYLQNPLILKYKFDIYQFYNGSKIALDNVMNAPYNKLTNLTEYLKLNCHPEVVDRLNVQFARIDNVIKDNSKGVFTIKNYYIDSITTKIVGYNTNIYNVSNIDVNNMYNDTLLTKAKETIEWIAVNFPENCVVASIKVSGLVLCTVKRIDSTDSALINNMMSLSAQFDGCLSKLNNIEWKIVDLDFFES